MNQIQIVDLNKIDYEDAWKLQLEKFNLALQQKKEGIKPNQYLFLCEHNPVYTLGKNASEDNIIYSKSTLGAPVFKIERGGDVTFHGPGQIVGYPILDLEQLKMGLRTYIELIEETIIQTLDIYGLKGTRIKSASGVWIDAGTANERKICALGVKASRHITMHGFAFNVNTDLSWFQKINPCGFTDKGVTSLEKELGEKQDFEAVKKEVIKQFQKLF